MTTHPNNRAAHRIVRPPVGEFVTPAPPRARPASWARAHARLVSAPLYWLSTVRPDGRPHATPLLAVWWHESLFFAVGSTSVKHRNLRHNQWCVLTTGSDDLEEGLDLAVEGPAHPVNDRETVQQVAGEFVAKYTAGWPFRVHGRDGEAVLRNYDGIHSRVHRVTPAVVYGFSKKEEWTQTRWYPNHGPTG
ncbi:pyridoxamine 5'-phosphate oxidase family protein [Streptomyces sp. DSM 44915]|uniref:Pyridoxamine 5'-phosphate oxidase family protein n=1 Tax=Streptomyces chisholmiae TaxID=3075540 RepID=A0ABU2JM95_9ACTN|nr:pyridoxamine 5'-phosphate oxidase family protein [Streptomyces sp. DSM 44915]MDT0266111.1 pyridoxamine 5'-phosphate oxidase family protein [Streptomyces sp. DSM 44915]